MGLIADNGKFGILTDIQGLEDHYGDMVSRSQARGRSDSAQMDNKAGALQGIY